MTQRRWGLVFARAVFVTVVRLPLLALPGDEHRAVWLLVAVTLPTALSGIAGIALARTRHRRSPPPHAPPCGHQRDGALLARELAVDGVVPGAHVRRAGHRAVHVDASTNASFYVAWGVASLACYVPTAIGQALLTEGGRDGAHLRAQVRLALLAAVGLMVVGGCDGHRRRGTSCPRLYGEDYREAADILPGLVAAAIPWAITSIYLTEARVRHRTADTVAITVALSRRHRRPDARARARPRPRRRGPGLRSAGTWWPPRSPWRPTSAAWPRPTRIRSVPPAHEHLEPEDVVVLAPLT